jgi:hypothetical protein
MWTPKQLLTDETVDSLRQGGFSEIEIEFLGWLNGTASALNNSMNPVKAAHTIMAKETMAAMAEKFEKKKKESVSAPDHIDPNASAARRKLPKLGRWQQEKEAESKPKAKGAAAGDEE